MREYRGERDRGSASSHDISHDVVDRRSTERTPEQTATERVFRLRQATEAAATRARNLPGIVQRDEWRTERASLTETHAALSQQLEQHAADAALSKQAQQHHDAAVNDIGEIATALTSATEPRAIPPVPGEEGLEPRIIDRSAKADDVLAWVAELGGRERRALAERLQRVQGSADRRDRFAVELANYLAATRMTSQFLGVAENPRRFNRAAYEKARAAANARGAAEQGGASASTPPALGATSENNDAGAALDLDAPGARGGSLPYRAEMERSFGRAFGDVDAHTGVAAALAPLGAQALTVGRTVAFAEAQPSPALVAHEATHVVQNEQAGTAMAMASGVVAPRESSAEAEADASAHLVATHGPGVRLPPIAAAPAAHVHLAPKLLVPDADASPPKSTLLIPDANHPARRDMDGEQVIQTGEMIGPGKASPLRGKSWASLAEVAESVKVQDDSGDTLRIDITYRLESRPAELGEIPDTWIHTERKALLTIGTGEHAGATIVGQARIRLAPGEPRDPKMAIAKASIGPSHWAQIYLAESQQFVNLHGADGRPSLRADAADNDVLAYDDPLRTLVGLKNTLKQQHVAGHGGDVAKTHARAQRLLAEATRGRALLEREVASIRSHHDPQPGRVAPVRFLIGDMGEWLAANQQAGRDDTEEARQLRKARAELEHLIADAENAHAPKRDQLDDALSAPGRFVERTAEGVVEVGAMAVDAVVLGVDVLGEVTGIGTFDYHPISKFGRSIDASGADTTTALVTMVNGFADEWSEATERAKHGDYRGLTDVSIDTLMMIDGARTGGAIALDKVEAVAAKIGRVARSAHALAKGLHGEIRDIAAAMADGADAFAARLSPGMQMATSGGDGPGPIIDGLSGDVLAEAAKAAKEAFKDKRAQQAHGHGNDAGAHEDAAKPSPDRARPADTAHADAENVAADKAAADKAAVDKAAADKAAADKAAADKAAADKAAADKAAADKAAADKAAAEKAEKEAQRAAKSAAGNAETSATKKYTFDASEKPTVEKKIRDAAFEAAEKAYRDAIDAGETHGQANSAANKAAKDVAENAAKAEALRSATESARRAIARDGAFDAAKLDGQAQSQLADFTTGKSGAEAKRLARDLDGLGEKDFLTKMAGEPCTMKTVNVNGPPPQVMRVYEYPDGTVVRYKPIGDTKRPGPTYSIEVKKNPAAPDLSPDDAAFKVDASGTAVPKGPFDVKNPYPKGSPQAVRFERTVMDAGHKTLEVRP